MIQPCAIEKQFEDHMQPEDCEFETPVLDRLCKFEALL